VLHVTESAGGCRLSLAGCASGYGATLQEAADDLIRSVLRVVAIMVRGGAAVVGSTAAPRLDPRTAELMHELGRLAAAGGDVRQRLFGPGATAASPGPGDAIGP
jgi:hypothetical protein